MYIIHFELNMVITQVSKHFKKNIIYLPFYMGLAVWNNLAYFSSLPPSGNNFDSSLDATQVHQESNQSSQSNQSNQGCPVAGCKARNLSYQARVRVHWMEKHEPFVNMYKCCICNYKSKRRRNVDTHMFKMHQIHDGSHVSSGDEINTQYINREIYAI